MRYHFTLVRTAIIKKSTYKCRIKCGEKGALMHCGWVFKLEQPLCKTVWRFLKKQKTSRYQREKGEDEGSVRSLGLTNINYCI